MLDKPPSVSFHDKAWKVFKDKGMDFGHLSVNRLPSKTEELITLTFNTNISVSWNHRKKLDNTVSNEELKTDGCNFLQSDINKNGGWIACYIKNKIAHNRLSLNF